MSNLEPPTIAAEPDEQLELALRSVYWDEATPTLCGLHKDSVRLASFERLLAVFGDQLPERQVAVLVRTLWLQGWSAETLEVVGRDLGVTRERVRAIGKQALGNLRKAVSLQG